VLIDRPDFIYTTDACHSERVFMVKFVDNLFTFLSPEKGEIYWFSSENDLDEFLLNEYFLTRKTFGYSTFPEIYFLTFMTVLNLNSEIESFN
jgi:YHS domain-containing protein